MDASQVVILVFVASGVAALATPVAARLAFAFDVVDRPNERKVNEREGIPLLGGLAVAAGTVAGLAAGVFLVGDSIIEAGRLQGYLIGGSMLLTVGALDDRWGLNAGPKLVVQLAAAAIAIHYGFTIPHVTEPLTRTTLVLPVWLSYVVTVLWIVGVTNAMNLIDGLDGLSSGLGAIIATTLTIICWQSNHVGGVILGLSITGALLGFLPYNFPPARIFVGDTGALFMGYTLSLLVLEGYRTTALLTFVVPLLALAVPLLDTLLSILRRLGEGRPVFSADKRHMHHRLLEYERSDRRAVLSLYSLTACFCIIAVSFTKLHGYSAIIFLVAVLLLTIRLLRNLDVLPRRAVSIEPAEPEIPPTAPTSVDGMKGEHR